MTRFDILVFTSLGLIKFWVKYSALLSGSKVNRPEIGYEIVGNIKVVSIDSFTQVEVVNNVNYVTSEVHVYYKHGFRLHTQVNFVCIFRWFRQYFYFIKGFKRSWKVRESVFFSLVREIQGIHNEVRENHSIIITLLRETFVH